jgi:hypothetical protein
LEVPALIHTAGSALRFLGRETGLATEVTKPGMMVMMGGCWKEMCGITTVSMCRDAVLNIVSDALQFNYMLWTRRLMVSATSRRLLCRYLIVIWCDRCRTPWRALPRPRMVSWRLWNASTGHNEPRNRCLTPDLPLHSAWPPHATPDQAVEPDQHVPDVEQLFNLNSDWDKVSSFVQHERGPIQAHHHVKCVVRRSRP